MIEGYPPFQETSIWASMSCIAFYLQFRVLNFPQDLMDRTKPPWATVFSPWMWVVCGLCVCATSDFVLGSLSWPSHPSGQQRWPICPASSASSKGGEFPVLGLPVTWTHPQKLPGPEHALHGKSEAIHGPWCQHGSNARKSHQMLNTREKECWAWINTTRIVNTSRIVKYCPSRLLFAGCPLTDLHIRLPSVLVKGFSGFTRQ